MRVRLGVSVKVVRREVFGSVRCVKGDAVVAVRVRVLLRDDCMLLLRCVRDSPRKNGVRRPECGHSAAHVTAVPRVRVQDVRSHVHDAVRLRVNRARELRFTRVRRSRRAHGRERVTDDGGS